MCDDSQYWHTLYFLTQQRATSSYLYFIEHYYVSVFFNTLKEDKNTVHFVEA